jgi:uncharacterized coiled-coil protein SlyX
VQTGDDPLDARLAELETRLAFQDDLVGELNREVSEQALAIAAMRRELEWLRESLARVGEADGRPGGPVRGNAA